MEYICNADYEERDTRPLLLNVGDIVTIGAEDRAWPGWIWVVRDDGRAGYVPAEILNPATDGKCSCIAGFDPSVLTVRRGDHLLSVRQIHGWHWCRNNHGEEGWVAGYLLRPA